MSAPANLAVLISGRGSNLKSLIHAWRKNSLSAEISLVISNVADAPGLAFARNEGISTCVIQHTDYSAREDFDHALLQELQNNSIDTLALAGFMRILTPQFTDIWRGRMINIHPSLLPLHPGLNTHARAIAAGDKQSGASVHFVTPELDGGPVILQGVVDVEPDDSAATLGNRVLSVEHIIYPMALQWLVTERVSLQGEDCYLDGTLQQQPPRWYDNQLQLQSTTQ